MQKAPFQTFHVSNLLTYTSLLTAGLAMWSAMHGHRLNECGFYLGISIIADLFDGKFARFFRRDSLQCAFGGQIDSLVDAVAFGVAPIVCIWNVFPALGFVSFGLSFLYTLCALTRLGFFNLTAGDQPNVFVGLTTTLAGLVWLVVFLFQETLGLRPWTLNSVLILLAVGMVAPLRYRKPGVKGMVGLAFLVLVLMGAHLYGARIF